jgi:hypothetical protein
MFLPINLSGHRAILYNKLRTTQVEWNKNPQNKSGFDSKKDLMVETQMVTLEDHILAKTGRYIRTPHVNENRGVRIPLRNEFPMMTDLNHDGK